MKQTHQQVCLKLTSIQGAFFSAHSSMDLRNVTLGVRVMGLFILWPVAGHLELPWASHLSMYRRSYLMTNNASFGFSCLHAQDVSDKSTL